MTDLMWVPKGQYCMCCGNIMPREKLQRHHTFFKRTKNKRAKESVDDERNITLVCARCHSTDGTTGLANSRDYKLRAWIKQCERYGRDSMIEWYNSVPLIIKERFWEEDKNEIQEIQL